MGLPSNVSEEIARYSYHDQNEHAADYVVAALKSPVNGNMFGIYVVNTGKSLEGEKPTYSDANSRSEAKEVAYRAANELPKPRLVYCGKCHTGVSKRSAEIWIAKNKSYYENSGLLAVVHYKGKFAVRCVPKDWGLVGLGLL